MLTEKTESEFFKIVITHTCLLPSSSSSKDENKPHMYIFRN